MTQQEQAFHDFCKMKILWLEQEKEELRQEYLERIAAINLEILQLQNRNSNVTNIQTDFK